MTSETAIKAAKQVMSDHVEALNARDEAALAATLHFPHVRLSGANLKVWETPESYFADFQQRAGARWARSRFDDIQLVRASDTKVHLDAEIIRSDAEGNTIARFRSLWVITLENAHWAAKLRSSFAPQ